MITLTKTKLVSAKWDETNLSIDVIDELIDEQYSYEEKKGSMYFTGRIGEDTKVSVFAHTRSNVMNIICSKKETVLRVQEWCRDMEENTEDLKTDVTTFDILGAKYGSPEKVCGLSIQSC